MRQRDDRCSRPVLISKCKDDRWIIYIHTIKFFHTSSSAHFTGSFESYTCGHGKFRASAVYTWTTLIN